MPSGKSILDTLASQIIASEHHDNETYKIGELAGEFSLSLRALRFYEDYGLLTPRRAGNKRIYSLEDRNRLRLIVMSKKFGFSLRDVEEVLKIYDDSDIQDMEFLVQKLTDQRVQVMEEQKELQKSLESISDAISYLSRQK